MTTHVVIVQEYVPLYRLPFFLRLVELAKQRDIDVKVIAGSAGAKQSMRQDGAEAELVIPIWQREIRFGRRRIVFRRITQETRSADLVIFEQARRNLDIYRLFLPRHSGRPLVALWGHGRFYGGDELPMDRNLRRAITLRADWFFAYTNAGADAVADWGFDRTRTTVVRNSIDTTALFRLLGSVTDDALAIFTEVHRLTQHTALYIGGLDNKKRLDFLFDAADLVYLALPTFRLLVAGAGVDAGKVASYAATRSWVSYLGPVFGPQKALALRASQILVIPGAIGLVAVDSIVAGTPIVTTLDPQHGPEFDYLSPGRNVLVSRDNVVDYAAQIEGLMRDRGRLLSFSMNCRVEAKEYSIELMAENFLRGIQGALTTAAGRGVTA